MKKKLLLVGLIGLALGVVTTNICFVNNNTVISRAEDLSNGADIQFGVYTGGGDNGNINDNNKKDITTVISTGYEYFDTNYNDKDNIQFNTLNGKLSKTINLFFNKTIYSISSSSSFIEFHIKSSYLSLFKSFTIRYANAYKEGVAIAKIRSTTDSETMSIPFKKTTTHTSYMNIVETDYSDFTFNYNKEFSNKSWYYLRFDFTLPSGSSSESGLISFKSITFNRPKAEDLAQEFNTNITTACNGGINPNITAIKTTWNTASVKYNQLSDSEKGKFVKNIPTDIQTMLDKYDLVYVRHYSNLGDVGGDFLKRFTNANLSKLSYEIDFIDISNGNNPTMICLIIGAVLIGGLGTYFLIRKKKEN